MERAAVRCATGRRSLMKRGIVWVCFVVFKRKGKGGEGING
jgi:hypothetical protein